MPKLKNEIIDFILRNRNKNPACKSELMKSITRMMQSESTKLDKEIAGTNAKYKIVKQMAKEYEDKIKPMLMPKPIMKKQPAAAPRT